MIADLRAKDRPFYARVLGLHYIRPSGLLCFFFFEGAIALATLLALAELVTWWAVVVLPGAIAVMVKINDLIAGFGVRSAARAQARAAVRTATRRAAKREAKAARRQAAREEEAVAELVSTAGPDEDFGTEAPAVGRASVPQPYAGLAAPDEVRSSQARRRQSAAHRYD
ncbi:hypothetical protein [Hamadaea sp.]|uniref:hypothetical protein n=1 Tax=Hamadaea sp. TaxID=2024425 RepID=UPI0025BE53D7|nr:hypothetical protein [Hamadaea sp.]